MGVSAIEKQINPLVEQAYEGIKKLGHQPMCALDQKTRPTGIIAFQSEHSAQLHAALEAADIHVMHHAGRIRIALHGYNTAEDVERLLGTLAPHS